jgi:exodeoxyribonuclease VII large subunit
VTLPLPFGPDSSTIGVPDDVWSVGELCTATRAVVEEGFAPMWLRGEVSGLKVYQQSGHWYFDLRDESAKVRCTMWKPHAQRVPERPAEGAEVFVFGKPSFYEAKGEFSFSVQKLVPSAGIGWQQREFERVRQALAADGLFDHARKRPLPEFPETIALVTSSHGAALHDMARVARERWPGIRLILVPARVQGADAAPELVRALELVNRLDCDCCIVGRGGGSRDDLAVFNDERVCRALAAVMVPTVSAVGHETDVSLADLVADVRAATPSNACELAVPDQADVAAGIDAIAERLASGLTRHTRVLRERLARTGDRIEAAMQEALATHRFTVQRLAAQLDALSPLRVLERGFAIPQGPDGRLLRGRDAFVPGLRFVIRLADGTVPARVEEDG